MATKKAVPAKPAKKIAVKAARRKRESKASKQRRVMYAVGAQRDHSCKVCDRMNGITFKLVQELRTRMDCDYGMYVLLLSAEGFLRLSAQAQGAEETQALEALHFYVVDATRTLPFPPEMTAAEFPKAGKKQDTWEGRDALVGVAQFLLEGHSLNGVEAARVCVLAARALGMFVEDPEAEFMIAFGEAVLSRIEAGTADAHTHADAKITHVKLFGNNKHGTKEQPN